MTTPENINPKKKLKKWQIVFIIIAVLFVIGSLSGGNSSSTNSESSSSTTNEEVVDTSWAPTDFNIYAGDENIAWRWGTKSETKCSYSSGSCWSIVVLAKKGCSRSLYAEINIFDKNDVQIDYTNDTASVVQPMQKVKLTFDTFNEQSSSAGLAKFSCY